MCWYVTSQRDDWDEVNKNLYLRICIDPQYVGKRLLFHATAQPAQGGLQRRQGHAALTGLRLKAASDSR